MKNYWLGQEIRRNSKARKSAFVKAVVYPTQGKSPHIATSSQCSCFLLSWVINIATEGRPQEQRWETSSCAYSGRRDCKHRVLPLWVTLGCGHLVPDCSFKAPVSYSPFTRHPPTASAGTGHRRCDDGQEFQG